MRRTVLTRFEASNLGQIIGRAGQVGGATSRAAEPTAQKAPQEPARPRQRKPSASAGVRFPHGRPAKILELLRGHPRGLLCADIAAALCLDRSVCAAYLAQMPELDRLGERRPYTYRVKSAAP